MFFDLRTKYKHEHRHTWWSQNKIQTRSLDWNRSMHSSFIWWCTQEKKCTYQTETSVRSTRLEQNAWAKNTTWPASWSHSSSFFFWNETLINYNTREQSDAAKIRPKPCITSSYYRQLTYSLSDAHLHHHRAHLDHLHYQWLWAQSIASRLGTDVVYPFLTKTRQRHVHPLLRHQDSQLFSCYSRIQSQLVPPAGKTFKWTILQHRESRMQNQNMRDSEIKHFHISRLNMQASQYMLCIWGHAWDWRIGTEEPDKLKQQYTRLCIKIIYTIVYLFC